MGASGLIIIVRKHMHLLIFLHIIFTWEVLLLSFSDSRPDKFGQLYI